MHKLLTILFCLFSIACFSQTGSFVERSSGVVTTIDNRGGAKWNWYMPYNINDTSLNGGLDTLGAILHVRSGSKQGFWYRDSISTGGHKWVRLAATAETYWTLNGTDLYPNLTTYDVGIGTTNPSYKLHVVNGGELYFDGTRLGLFDNSTRNNILIGSLSGSLLSTTYNNNIGVGASALRFVTGNYNTGLGTTALQNANGSKNTAIGYQSLYLTDSSDNTGVGYLNGIANYGKQNTNIGSSSGSYLALGNGTVNNSEIQTSSTAITGSTTATFITAQSLSIGVKYPFLIHFNSTAPEPYNSASITDVYVNAVVTNSNTLTLSNASNFTTTGSGTMTITLYNKQNNAIAIGYNVQTDSSNQIKIGNSSNTVLKSNQLVFDLTTVPTTGYVLTWDGTKYSPAAGGASSLTFTVPLVNTAGVVTINNAAADGSTKGASAYNASDFNAASGVITIDYTNGQAASGSTKGFLSSTDWTTFNSKASAATGAITPFYSSNATASRAIVSDGSGKLAVATTTATEIGYVNGVTSAIQTQLNAKLGTSLTSGQILVGNGSNVAAGVAMSGDATISNAGVLTLKNSGVVAGTYGSANITVDAQGRVTAAADGTGGGGAGTVTTVLGTSPIISDGDLVTPTISILNAKADGSTKGAAWFSSADFNDNGSGGISIDYTNGQAASAGAKGFLTAADWTTFNNKVPTTTTITAGTGLTGGGDLSTNRTITLNSIAGFIAAGTNISITGTGSISSPYTISSTGGGGGSGTVTTVSGVNTNGFTWSIVNASTTPALTLSLQNAAADGSTKGQATFTASDFNATTGLISLDYANMQIVTGSVNGLVTPTLYNTWNAKQDAITGAVTTVVSSNLTSNRIAISNSLGKLDVSTVTPTQLAALVNKTFQALSLSGSNISWVYGSGYNATYTITANRSIVISGDADGDYGTLIITQNGTGGWDLTVPNTDFLQDGINVVGSPFTIDLPDAAGSVAVVSWVNHSGVRYWTFGYYHQ